MPRSLNAGGLGRKEGAKIRAANSLGYRINAATKKSETIGIANRSLRWHVRSGVIFEKSAASGKRGARRVVVIQYLLH